MPPSAPFTRLIGSGGTKITTDGVDFWTSGNPPRAYLVLGVLMDSEDAPARRGSPMVGNA